MEKIQYFSQFLHFSPLGAEICRKRFFFFILTILSLIFPDLIGTFCQLTEAPCLFDSIMLKLR